MSTPGKVPFAAPKYLHTHSSWLNPMGMRGIVTTPHYLASQTGLSILQHGGNAVDAAIAAAATLSVVYPHMAALGGDNFWLVYKATTGELHGLNASGRAGRRATISFYAGKQFGRIPSRGYYAANTVPGSVSRWGEAHRYSKEALHTRLCWKDLFADAIQYAENGFPVSASLAKWLRDSVNIINPELDNLQRFAGFRQTFLMPDASPYEEGKILRQGDLAATLVRLAEEGPEDFYHGDIARKIVADLELNDELLSMEDFAQHRAEWVEPISVPYRDTVAFNLPPNSQGIASLSILNILNQFELADLPEGSVEHYHLIIEATKAAFRDRDSYVTDPAFLEIPVKEILSLEHGQAQAARIGLTGTTSRVDLRGGVPFLVYGTMGGEGQPQTQAAIVTRIVDYRLSPRDAIEAPRWLYGRTWGADTNNVRVEARVPPEVVAGLQQRGHPIEIVEPYAHIMGHAGAILISSENRILYGASDPRSDGIAAGF
jgi:gamma-glutamyltranspeptidase